MLVKIISAMLDNTYTTDDLVERLGLMKKYYGKVLYSEGSTNTMDEIIGTECDDHTLQSLQVWVDSFKTNKIQPVAVYEALDAIQEELAGIPKVTLYTPVRFPPEHVERFGKWFRRNVQPNILMNMHVDPRATGGCGVVWDDTYHDYSLRYYIHKDRTRVVEMFNKYSNVEQ